MNESGSFEFRLPLPSDVERRRASINETKADGSSEQVGHPVCRVKGPLSGCTSCQMASCQETRYPPGFNPEGSFI